MIEALKTLNRLKRAGVIKDYVIGGGYAVNYYLEPILTYDLDIYVLMTTDKEYTALYQYFRSHKYGIKNVYIVIEGMPVQFLPSFISPLVDEAIRRAKRIRVKGTTSKVLTVEYLIATLLMAFRPKDKMVIPHLLEQADMQVLSEILGRFGDEKAPLDNRLGRILESLQ